MMSRSLPATNQQQNIWQLSTSFTSSHDTDKLENKTYFAEIFCRAHTRTSLKRNMWRSFRVFPTFSTIRPCLAK